MKKKILTVLLSVIGSIAALVLLLGAVIVCSGNQKTIARCIVTDNHSLYMHDDEPQSADGTVLMLEQTSGEEESSYQIGITLPATDFSVLGQPLAQQIAQDWKTYDGLTELQRLASSKLWGHAGIQTDTWDECEQTIGFTVHNPLESLGWLNQTGYFGMESANPDIPVKHILINASSSLTSDRKVNEINVTAGYNTEDIRITLCATLSSATETHRFGSVYNGYATYEEVRAATGSGIPVLIVTATESKHNGYYHADYFDPTAYWVKDNVLYTLRVFGKETERVEIQETLDRILEEI